MNLRIEGSSTDGNQKQRSRCSVVHHGLVARRRPNVVSGLSHVQRPRAAAPAEYAKRIAFENSALILLRGSYPKSGLISVKNLNQVFERNAHIRRGLPPF
jgi:hypothetical protein